jgi:hypothetical protein
MPVPDLSDLRGLAKGVSNDFVRDRTDRY